MGKKKKLTVQQIQYQKKVVAKSPEPNRGKNAFWAFVWGGVVCLIGQFFADFYSAVLGLSMKDAATPALTTMIFLGALLTGCGVFDKMAKHAGAGLAVPITGFANAMAASALEFKSEGLVLGIGSKMFILAGSVVTYGVVTAFFVGLIYALIN